MLRGIWDWLVRLIGGWIPVGDKPIREWFGKILWVVGIIFFFNFVSGLFRQPSNTNHPTVIALPWSTVGNVDQANDQKAEVERKWWMPIPYISLAGEATSDARTDAKVEAGLRWDF